MTPCELVSGLCTIEAKKSYYYRSERKKEARYTEAEIEEYGHYIELFKKVAK